MSVDVGQTWAMAHGEGVYLIVRPSERTNFGASWVCLVLEACPTWHEVEGETEINTDEWIKAMCVRIG